MAIGCGLTISAYFENTVISPVTTVSPVNALPALSTQPVNLYPSFLGSAGMLWSFKSSPLMDSLTRASTIAYLVSPSLKVTFAIGCGLTISSYFENTVISPVTTVSPVNALPALSTQPVNL